MRKLVIPTLFSSLTSAGLAFSIDGNLLTAAGVLVATVASTLAVIRWIDERIEHKINNALNVIHGEISTLRAELKKERRDERSSD